MIAPGGRPSCANGDCALARHRNLRLSRAHDLLSFALVLAAGFRVRYVIAIREYPRTFPRLGVSLGDCEKRRDRERRVRKRNSTTATEGERDSGRSLRLCMVWNLRQRRAFVSESRNASSGDRCFPKNIEARQREGGYEIASTVTVRSGNCK